MHYPIDVVVALNWVICYGMRKNIDWAMVIKYLLITVVSSC